MSGERKRNAHRRDTAPLLDSTPPAEERRLGCGGDLRGGDSAFNAVCRRALARKPGSVGAAQGARDAGLATHATAKRFARPLDRDRRDRATRPACRALDDPRLSENDLEARVERVAETEPTDGLWMERRGRLYLSAIEQDAVKVLDGNRSTTLVRDKRLRWPDTFSEGPDGTIYVTSSRIQDMSWFKPENGPRLETQLWRIEPGLDGQATGPAGQPPP